MATVSRSGKKWRAQVRMAGARPLSRSFATKQDAQRWAREQEGLIVQGRGSRPVPRETVGDVLRAYLQDAPPAASRSRAAVLRMLERELGPLRLTKLNPQALIRFARRRARDGAGPPTVMMDLIYLRTAVRHGAIQLELDPTPMLATISASSSHLRHLGLVGSSSERSRRPTDGELARLRAYWEENPTRFIPMWRIVRFAIATTMRMAEITRIEWETFDPASRTIVVPERKHPIEKRGNSQRVPLLTFAHVCGELVDPVALMGTRGRGRVFPFDGGSVSANFTRACAALGIEDLCFHDLRHDGVSRLFEAGFDIPRVALVSGHRSWRSLSRYTQIKPESLHEYGQ